MTDPASEKTFVLIKPDAVGRNLIGEIITRFEKAGLKVIALEMSEINREIIDGHYPKDPAWITRLGQKLVDGFTKKNADVLEKYGTNDPEKLGPMVREWLLDYFTMGPVVKMVIQGTNAVDMGRKIVGSTMPADAAIGTIRGDYSTDSAFSANGSGRTVFNLVHASETQAEALHEIDYWFKLGK